MNDAIVVAPIITASLFCLQPRSGTNRPETDPEREDISGER